VRQFASIETVMTAVVDSFPRLRTKKFIVAPCICAALYLLGLTMCTQVRHRQSYLAGAVLGIFIWVGQSKGQANFG